MANVITINSLIEILNFIKSDATNVANNILLQSSNVCEIALRFPIENRFIIILWYRKV